MNSISKLALAKTMTNSKRRSKYNNRKVTLDGKKFDSIKESFVYSQLKLREKAGEIKDLECQHKIPLVAHNFATGAGERFAWYVCDFKFYDLREARVRYVDAKGVKTAMFNMKARIVAACYGIQVETV